MDNKQEIGVKMETKNKFWSYFDAISGGALWGILAYILVAGVILGL